MMIDELSRLRALARDACSSKGAFVRIDRGQALFVTDAPRKGAFGASALQAFFDVRLENGLAYLTPKLDFVPQRLRKVYLRILKSDPDAQNVLIRQALAESMRLKADDEIQFMNALLKRRSSP